MSGTEASEGGSDDIQWYLTQLKGPDPQEQAHEADLITAVEFNEDGELLATGDKGGRIVVFTRSNEKCPHSGARCDYYDVYITFTSHEPEFDYLKSLEIEERINNIKFLQRSIPPYSLLSSNDKTIKLWKLVEKKKRAEGLNIHLENGNITPDNIKIESLIVPRLVPMPTVVSAISKCVYRNGHTYHINSLSLFTDGETFLSADDLRINLWHLEIENQLFNIVDLKPTNMEDLSEVITAAQCHPKFCNIFAYTSSKGLIRLCDTRSAALCDNHAKLFEMHEEPSNRSFFTEIISSVSDIKFSHCGNLILTRDYLTVKIWDIRAEARPLEMYSVHNHLRQKLCQLYENDCIFDKFDCCWSGNDRHILTGSYGNLFTTTNRSTGQSKLYEVSLENTQPNNQKMQERTLVNTDPSNPNARRNNEISIDSIDFNRKLIHNAWNPQADIIAVAATNNLYFYSSRPPYQTN